MKFKFQAHVHVLRIQWLVQTTAYVGNKCSDLVQCLWDVLVTELSIKQVIGNTVGDRTQISTGTNKTCTCPGKCRVIAGQGSKKI